MTIGGKEYKELERELTADEYLRCGIIDSKYSKTIKEYMEETDDTKLDNIWNWYKSFWLKRIAFFIEGDVSGLALDKITDIERQAVDDFFTEKFLPYVKRSKIFQEISKDTPQQSGVSYPESTTSTTSVIS